MEMKKNLLIALLAFLLPGIGVSQIQQFDQPVYKTDSVKWVTFEVIEKGDTKCKHSIEYSGERFLMGNISCLAIHPPGYYCDFDAKVKNAICSKCGYSSVLKRVVYQSKITNKIKYEMDNQQQPAKTLTIEEVKAVIAFDGEIKQTLEKMVELKYLIELEAGKSKHEAARSALDYLGEQLGKMNKNK